MIDMHIHTTLSDGGKNIQEIISDIEDNSIISITDHNHFEDCKQNYPNIIIINGIELEVKYHRKRLHMLLYDFDFKSKEYKRYEQKIRKSEITNFNKKIKLLESNYGLVLDRKKVNKFIKQNQYFDKVRLNNLLTFLKITKTPREAFYKYTKNIKESKRKTISLKQAFELEKKSKGILSLAHPQRYHLNEKKMTKLILFLKEKYNLRAIEAINNHATEEEIKQNIDFCNKEKLLISAGSDYHKKYGEDDDKKIGHVKGRKINSKEISILKLIKN